MSLGEKLKKTRLERGMTQSQVCGDRITRNMLSQLENDLASPSVKTLEYLADVLGVTPGWLLEENPVQECLAEARAAYSRGEFETCVAFLRGSAAAEEEEGRYLLIRSAVRLCEAAAADGRFQEARETASMAVQLCENCLYADRLDKLRADAVLLRCAMETGGNTDDLLRTVRTDFIRMDLSEDCHLLMARYALSQGHLQTAAKELLAVGEPTPRARGEWLILNGIGEMEQKHWQKAEESLRRAEAAPVLNKVQRRELYRLLERCCKEREDYKQAYYYASRQLQLEETDT